MLPNKWRYRTRQFQRALWEAREPFPRGIVERYLEGKSRELFRLMTPRDQAHSAHTAELIERRIPHDRELIIAALLHDVGKGQQSIGQRVLYVLAAAIAPGHLERIARGSAGLRGSLYRSLHHAKIGAEIAADAGCSSRVCRLIEAHHDGAGPSEGTAILRWADEIA